MPNSEENITYFCWHTILCSSINRHFRGQICGLQNFTHLRYIIYTFTVIYFCYEFIVIFHTCSFLEFVTLQPDGHLSHVHRLTPFTNTHASSKRLAIDWYNLTIVILHFLFNYFVVFIYLHTSYYWGHVQIISLGKSWPNYINIRP